MMKYLRLYAYFVQFSFSRALEFRIDFSFRIIMDVTYFVVNICLFQILFRHTSLIGGWNLEQMMIFVSAYLLVDALNMTIFSSNLWWLPFYINRGELDYYLTRPVNPLFFLSLREFSANSFVNLLMAVGIFIFSISQYSGSWDLWKLIGMIFLLLNGLILYYLIQLMTILPTFWTQSSKGFIDLFYTMTQAMERPDRIFKGWQRILFTTIFPFSLIASFPARFFIEHLSGNNFLHLSIVSLVFWVIVLSLWRAGLKVYSSASS